MQKNASSIKTSVFVNSLKNAIVLNYDLCFSDMTNLQGELSVYYPLTLKKSFDIKIIENYFQIFLSQLYLYDGDINLECSSDEFPFYKEVTEGLYAIRNYDENLYLFPNSYNINYNYISESNCIESNDVNVINLVSGGKDSCVADYLLTINNANVFRCFISGLNIKSNDGELQACHKLYKDRLDVIRLEGFESLITFLSNISDCYGKPPSRNFIPRGRDILTIALVYPLAINRNCQYISHGCEKDLWENNIFECGMNIPLHDSQSKLIIEPMNKQMSISTGIHVFSPIAGMHEIYILTWLLKNFPEKAKQLQFCFWGEGCGECTKCIRYYLIERHNQKHLFNFRKNPADLIPDLRININKSDAEKKIRFYNELKYLLGDDTHKDALFNPTYDRNFPTFFERWSLT